MTRSAISTRPARRSSASITAARPCRPRNCRTRRPATFSWQGEPACRPATCTFPTFDLNVDNGQVDAAAEADAAVGGSGLRLIGRRRGIYIINYLGAGVHRQPAGRFSQRGPALRLLNAAGYWLKGRSPRRGVGLHAAGPHDSRSRAPTRRSGRMHSKPRWSVADGGHVFTWHRLAPAAISGCHPAALHRRHSAFSCRLGDDAGRLASFARRTATDDADRLGLARAAHDFHISGCSCAGAGDAAACGRPMISWNQRVLARTAETRPQLRVAAGAGRSSRRDRQARESRRLGDRPVASGPAAGPTRSRASMTSTRPVEPSRSSGCSSIPGKSRERMESALQKSLADGTPYDLELSSSARAAGTSGSARSANPAREHGKVVRHAGRPAGHDRPQDIGAAAADAAAAPAPAGADHSRDRRTAGPDQHLPGRDPHAGGGTAAGFRLRRASTTRRTGCSP